MNTYRLALVLIASVCAFIWSPAFACDHVAYANLQNGYVFQDVASVGTRKPVIQGGVTATCGKWSYDLWTSTELSNNGKYGDRGYGDEIDLTATYTTQVSSPIGPLTVQTSAAYFVLSDFSLMKDDVAQVYIDMGRPISVGKATVTPYARAQSWIGINTIPTTNFARFGIRYDRPLSPTWSVSIEATKTYNLTDHTDLTWGNVFLTKNMGTWDLTFGAKNTEHQRSLAVVGVSRSF